MKTPHPGNQRRNSGSMHRQAVEQAQCLGGRIPARAAVGTPAAALALGEVAQAVSVEQSQHHPAPRHAPRRIAYQASYRSGCIITTLQNRRYSQYFS